MSDTEERPASPGDEAAATSTAGDGEKRRKGRGMKSGGANGAAVPGDEGAGPAPCTYSHCVHWAAICPFWSAEGWSGNLMI